MDPRTLDLKLRPWWEDEDEPERNRVGDYIRALLPRLIARRGIGWEVSVGWSSASVSGSIGVGRQRHTEVLRERRWWEPVTREHARGIARDLADRLERHFLAKRAEFLASRPEPLVWPMPDRERQYALEPIEGVTPVRLELKVGWYLDRAFASAHAIVRFYGEREALTLSEALTVEVARIVE